MKKWELFSQLAPLKPPRVGNRNWPLETQKCTDYSSYRTQSRRLNRMRAQQCATNRNEKGDFLLLRQFRMAMKFSKEKEGGKRLSTVSLPN